MNILESAKKIAPHLIELRRAFHRDPELSGMEERTAERIVSELREIGGYEIREHIAGHGVIAEIRGALPGPVTALRADMDALPIEEETGLPFASANSGVMHACGHDFHMTMLLGAARLIKERRTELRGRIRLIFQPAEEIPFLDGSGGMIRAGALEDVSAIFGMHCWPELPAGTFGIRPGEMMAASEHFEVRIKGKSSHGAQPHRGNDALLAGCQYVQAIQSVISRSTDPFEPAVITIGTMQAGVKYNVIAAECRMEGTIRTYSQEVLQTVKTRLKEILRGICTATGCSGEFTTISDHPAVINDETLTAQIIPAAGEIFGVGNVADLKRPTSISEDFSKYGRLVPSAFGFIGVTSPGDPVWPLHSSHLSPDETVLHLGAAMHTAFVLSRSK